MSFINTDDKTGKHSDTTLRTWILFFILVIYAMSICVATALSLFGVIDVRNSSYSLDLLEILSFVTFGQGALYLGKRFSERNAQKVSNNAQPQTPEQIAPVSVSRRKSTSQEG